MGITMEDIYMGVGAVAVLGVIVVVAPKILQWLLTGPVSNPRDKDGGVRILR